MGTDFQCQHKPYRESRTSSWSLFIVVVDCSVVESLPRETRSTLCIVLLIAWCQDCGSKESLTVFVPSAYLVASSGKLLWRAGNAAIVLVFGAISAGLQQHKVIGSCHTLAARKRECSTWHSVVPSPLTSVLKRPGKDIRTKHSLSWRGKGELGCHTPWQWPFKGYSNHVAALEVNFSCCSDKKWTANWRIEKKIAVETAFQQGYRWSRFHDRRGHKDH